MNQSTAITSNDLKFINLLLIPGLVGIVLALVTNNITTMAIVTVIPLAFMFAIQIIKQPVILYFAVFVLNYFIMGILRYIAIDGVSIVMDVLMASTLILIFIHTALLRNIEWKYAFNVLTIGSFLWMLYCLAEIYNPTGILKAWVLSRNMVTHGFIISLIVSLLFNKYKWVKLFILFYAIFTLMAVIKVLMQKSIGFDYAEAAWLNAGAYNTHLLNTGIRYFSFFTDAGNFGSNMGGSGVLFFITAFNTQNKWMKAFFLTVASLAIYAMFLSGTRGAMVVPLAGLALYAIVSNNIKILIASGITLSVIYVFFAFTMIGQGNAQIRRMRTAFSPTEDASFNVRKINQKILGEHLKNKPFGEGLGLSGVENKEISLRLTTMVPNDSWYVKVWVETGIVGLVLYLAVLFIAIGKGSLIIMRKVKNKELKGVLTGLVCSIFGLLISAYGNPFWGQYPTAIFAFSGLAIVLKGAFFENELNKHIKEK